MGLSQGLFDRIRERVKKHFGPGGDAPDDPREPADGDINSIMYRLRKGARERTLLWMKYNNTWRHVEPYSFRYRAKDGGSPLFYGYCELHDEIHSFRLDRVQDIHNTDRPFSPRWKVEIA